MIKTMNELPNICGHLELVSFYNEKGYSTLELVYRLGRKLNDVILELKRYENADAETLKILNDKINYLLSDGLYEATIKALDSYIESGEIDTLIKKSIEDLSTSLANTVKEVKRLNAKIQILETNEVTRIKNYTTNDLGTVPNPKPVCVVYDSTRKKLILYNNNNTWVNLDGTPL